MRGVSPDVEPEIETFVMDTSCACTRPTVKPRTDSYPGDVRWPTIFGRASLPPPDAESFQVEVSIKATVYIHSRRAHIAATPDVSAAATALVTQLFV